MDGDTPQASDNHGSSRSGDKGERSDRTGNSARSPLLDNAIRPAKARRICYQGPPEAQFAESGYLSSWLRPSDVVIQRRFLRLSRKHQAYVRFKKPKKLVWKSPLCDEKHAKKIRPLKPPNYFRLRTEPTQHYCQDSVFSEFWRDRYLRYLHLATIAPRSPTGPSHRR